MSHRKVWVDVDVPDDCDRHSLRIDAYRQEADTYQELNYRIVQPALAQGDVIPAGLTQFLAETMQAFDADDDRFGDDKWGEILRGFVQALSAQREQP